MMTLPSGLEYRIDIRSGQPRVLVEWHALERPDGGYYRFPSREAADAQVKAFQRVQPHAVFRVVPA